MTRRPERGEALLLAALVLFLGALIVLPLLELARVGFAGGLAPMIEAFSSASAQRALWNSLESSALSAALSLISGTAAALFLGMTDLRRKGVFVFLLLIPMMIPPHVTAIAWIQALGPSSPLLAALGLAPELGSTHPLYSRGGVIALLAIQHAPLVLLVALAALRALPRDLIEAARASGASPMRSFTKVALPLLAPSLIAAYALAFIAAMGNFGIPALLGIPARYITLPVLVWRKLASFGPSALQEAAALAVMLALVAALLVFLQSRLAQGRRARLIGPPQRPLEIALGPARPWVEALFALAIAATLALPAASLFATALSPTYGVPLGFDTITFEHFDEVLFRQEVTLRAFLNSTLIAGVASALLALIAVIAARAGSSRAGAAIARAAGGLGDVAYAIPGLVISIAFILAFARPLPFLGVSIYGTLWIILAAYLCAFFAVAAKPVAAAQAQLDPSLDEAARIAGAGALTRLHRIGAPLLAPAAASGAILVFLTAYNEITVSALLWSGGAETIGTTIFNYEDGGYTTLAAAMSAVTVIATVGLMAALDRLGRNAPPGVVPWRL